MERNQRVEYVRLCYKSELMIMDEISDLEDEGFKQISGIVKFQILNEDNALKTYFKTAMVKRHG